MDAELLGLTPNEMKAYEALLKHGKSSASQISAYSGVPYGRIYPILSSLEEKGLAHLVPEQSKKYVPSDPKTLDHYIQKKKERLDKAAEEIKQYQSLYEEQRKEAVSIVKGKKNFHKLLRIIPKSKKYAYSIKYNFDTHPEIIRDVKNLIKKKVDYRVMGRIDEETEDNTNKWKKSVSSLKIKCIENDGVGISISDDQEVLIILINAGVIMRIQDMAFTKIMKQLFLAYDVQN